MIDKHEGLSSLVIGPLKVLLEFDQLTAHAICDCDIIKGFAASNYCLYMATPDIITHVAYCENTPASPARFCQHNAYSGTSVTTETVQ